MDDNGNTGENENNEEAEEETRTVELDDSELKSVTLKNGAPHGEVIVYNDDGSVAGKLNFEEGLLSGQTEFYENEQLSMSMEFEKGEQKGATVMYISRGNTQENSERDDDDESPEYDEEEDDDEEEEDSKQNNKKNLKKVKKDKNDALSFKKSRKKDSKNGRKYNAIISKTRDLRIRVGGKKVDPKEKNSPGKLIMRYRDGSPVAKRYKRNLIIRVDGHIRIDSMEDISISGENISLEAKKAIKMTAGSDFALKAGDNFSSEAGKDFSEKAGDNFAIQSGKDLTARAGGNFSTHAEKNFAMEARKDFSIKTEYNFSAQARMNMDFKTDINLTWQSKVMAKIDATMVDIKGKSMISASAGIIQMGKLVKVG